MQPDAGEVIDCDSTAGEPHLNSEDWGRAKSLRRYVGDGIIWRGSILLAPARPANSKNKFFASLTEDKIVERENLIIRSWQLSHALGLAISGKKLKRVNFLQ